MQKSPFSAKKPSHSKMPGKIVPVRKLDGVRSVGDYFSLESPKHGGFRSFDHPSGGEGVLDPADREAAAINDAIVAEHCRLLPATAVAGIIGGRPCRS